MGSSPVAVTYALFSFSSVPLSTVIAERHLQRFQSSFIVTFIKQNILRFENIVQVGYHHTTFMIGIQHVSSCNIITWIYLRHVLVIFIGHWFCVRVYVFVFLVVISSNFVQTKFVSLWNLLVSNNSSQIFE